MMTDFLGGKKRMPPTTEVDPREAELMRLGRDLAAAYRRLAIADEMIGREADRAAEAEQRLADAREHYLTGLADAAAMLLPTLRPGMFAHDPMPEDRISWQPVLGDRYDLPPLAGNRALAEAAA